MMNINRIVVLLHFTFLPLVICCQNHDTIPPSVKSNFCNSEDKVINKVLQVKEVQELSEAIKRETQGKYRVSVLVYDQDSIKYYLRTGVDRKDIFQTYYLFNVNKKTCEIRVENQLSGREFPLEEWQIRNKRYLEGDSNAFDDDVKKKTNAYDKEKKIMLPFDFTKYQLWNLKVDMGEIEDDEKYYKRYFSDNNYLKNIFDLQKQNNKEPQFYYLFDCPYNSFNVYMVVLTTKNQDGLDYEIVTIDHDYNIIDRKLLGALQGIKNLYFKIDTNLKITQYKGLIVNNKEFINGDIINTFKINEAGKIE